MTTPEIQFLGGVVFWFVGAFDDNEAGTVAFASPPVIDRMLNSGSKPDAPAPRHLALAAHRP